MNKTISQAQQKEPVILNTISPKAKNYHNKTNHSHAPLWGWSNLKYGLFMTAVIVIPPLIPGMSTRLLIMGYMFTVVGIYTALAIEETIKLLSPTKAVKRTSIKT